MNCERNSGDSLVLRLPIVDSIWIHSDGAHTFCVLRVCLRYDYKIAREYNWNVKNKASKGYEENYFFIFRDGEGVYYNELETR